jgi:hypothetical protein
MMILQQQRQRDPVHEIDKEHTAGHGLVLDGGSMLSSTPLVPDLVHYLTQSYHGPGARPRAPRTIPHGTAA